MMSQNDDPITETEPQIESDQKLYSSSSNAYTYSAFFIFVASLSVYFQIARDQQQFRPYIDTQSYFQQSSPKIYAGEVHYARIPVEYWEHRVQMIKALGLNSLSIYIMWNYHEIERGKFDFQTGNRNLTKFLYLAEKYQMKVLIRPGPYVCAQWDFGGLPARLLSIEGLEIRSNNELFMQQVYLYFKAVAPILIQHLWSVDDPEKCIIMLQIENQYGFYGADINYIQALRKMWHDLHFQTAQYYVDWFINIRKSHWPGANIGLNDAISQFEIDYIKLMLENVGMVFGGEIYSGWLTHWHEKQMQKKDPHQKIKQYKYLMEHNISYAMYMVHGGSNFGMTAGANAAFRENEGYGGHVTSYDYDAPISEQGAATQKYLIFRQQIMKHADWQVPDIPEPIKMITIPSMTPKLIGSMYQGIDFDNPYLTANQFYPFQSQQLKMFNQGIVIYRTKLPASSTSQYAIQIHDLGYIIINGIFQQLLDRTVSEHHSVNLTCQSLSGCTLDIVVEAMGHNNYDVSMRIDHKGLLKFVNNNHKMQVFQWKMYRVDASNFQEIKKFENNLSGAAPETYNNMTVLVGANFTLTETGDTYFNMTQFQKGYVWVNGHNLGRYWTVGPQYKIFCPGVWMNIGENQLIIMQMMYDGGNDQTKGELTLEQNEDD